MTVRRFRKRPSDVEAVQWDGDNWAEVKELLDSHEIGDHVTQDGDELVVREDMRVSPGEWLVRTADGQLYPSRHMVFVSNYDELGPEPVEP